jgi:hypothetical protein
MSSYQEIGDDNNIPPPPSVYHTPVTYQDNHHHSSTIMNSSNAPILIAQDNDNENDHHIDAQVINDVKTEEYNQLIQPLNLFDREEPSLVDGELLAKNYTCTFHDWDILNTYDETNNMYTWLLNHPVVQALTRLFTLVSYIVLSVVTPRFIFRIWSPPVHTYNLYVSNKKVVVQHSQQFNKLEQKSTRTDALVKDFVGSNITVQNVCQPFFFADEFHLTGQWNRLTVFFMYIWLFVTALLQYLMSFPAKAGYAFASLLMINFIALYFFHVIALIVMVIRHKERVKRRMQPLWQTLVFFLLWVVVFIFNMMGFKNKTRKDYVTRPLYSAYPALLIYLFTLLHFYPRWTFGSYSVLTMSFKQSMAGNLQQKVVLSLEDAESAKYALEKATKYHD